jgi:hypothetical protein
MVRLLSLGISNNWDDLKPPEVHCERDVIKKQENSKAQKTYHILLFQTLGSSSKKSTLKANRIPQAKRRGSRRRRSQHLGWLLLLLDPLRFACGILFAFKVDFLEEEPSVP